MVQDDSYRLLPQREIELLKKEVQDLKIKADKSSSREIVIALETLTRSMDAMLKLFTEAAHELRVEENEKSIRYMRDKLDKILEHDTVIAEGMVAISDMLKGMQEKHSLSATRPRSMSKPRQPPQPEPHFRQQEPRFRQEPDFFGPPGMGQPPRMAMPKGPVAMPSIPFPDLEEEPKKKGLFGRFKK